MRLLTNISTGRTVVTTSDEFLNAIIDKYQEYIGGIQKNVENRFASGTYKICKTMGNH